MIVIIVLFMYLCLDFWLVFLYVRFLLCDFVFCGLYVKVQVDVLLSLLYVSDENRKCFYVERYDILILVIRKLK